jgi:hypothetical protein
VSGQVQGFTEAQVQEMMARGAAIGLAATIRFPGNADARSKRSRWLAKAECGLQAS